jgi:hypothetical protein
MIAAAEPDPERADRLRRLVMLWGNGRSETITGPDGSVTYAGIPRSIFDAFGLSWLGTEDAGSSPIDNLEHPDAKGERPHAQPEAEPETGEEEPKVPDSPLVPRPRTPVPLSKTGATGKPGSQPAMSGPTLKRVNVKHLRDELSQLRDWRDGKGLSEPKQWEETLAEIMGQLSLARLGIPRILWDRLFTKESVRLEGAGRADVRTFVLPRSDWLVRGLEAYITLRVERDLPSDQEEAYRRYYCRMLRLLGQLAAEHARKRQTALEVPWSPAAACAQVLLARAWLRGGTSPDQSLTVQFAELLSDERLPTSNPEERVDSWSALVNATGGTHDRLREYLRQLLAMPQNEREIKLGLVDAGEVAAALADLQRTMRMVPVPSQVTDPKATQSRGLDEIIKIAELTPRVDENLYLIPEREFRSLINRSAQLQVLLREHSVAAHLKRVEAVLNTLGGTLIQAAPVAIGEWSKALAKLRDARFLDDQPGAPARRVEDFLDDEAGVPDTPAAQLAKALSAPAVEMRQLLETLKLGERAVTESFNYAKTYLASSAGDGDLSVVNSFGGTLEARTAAIRSTLEGSA